MEQWNQTISTTTNTCLIPGEVYCEKWESLEVKTFNYLDFIALCLPIIIIIIMIGFFRKK